MNEVWQWVDDRLKGKLVQARNPFQTLSLGKSPGRPAERTEEAYLFADELRKNWEHFRQTPWGRREDGVLLWAKKHLADVARPENGDGSLYDELKLLAATTFDKPMRRLQFVMGDLSGIQNFLFSIARIGSPGVARRLRARSFRLSLLVRTAAMYIADQLNLSYRHILMTAGGFFLMAVPEDANLDAVRRQMQQYLYRKYQGAIQLHLASVIIDRDQMQTVAEPISALHRSIQMRKNRPFADVLQREGVWDETVWLHEREAGAYCRSCGRETVRQAGEELCAGCLEDQEWGRRLPRAVALQIRPLSGEDPSALWGVYQADLLDSSALNQPSPHEIYLELWNGAPLPETPAGIRWAEPMMISNYVPERDGAAITFEELAEQAEGRRALGIFKGDLDHLGLLFSFGLRNERGQYGMAKYLSASRTLDAFLGQSLGSRIRDKFPFIYTVFAGGDDLFLLGPWSDIPPFAAWLHEELKSFTGNNPAITLSAAIEFVSYRMPIASAAQAAEERLDEAKETPNVLRLYRNGAAAGRNQLNVLGHLIEWEHLPLLLERVADWREWEEKYRISRSFWRKMLEFSQMFAKAVFEGYIQGFKYHALLTYEVSRLQIRSQAGAENPFLAWIGSLQQYPPDERTEAEWHVLPLVYRLFEYGDRKENRA